MRGMSSQASCWHETAATQKVGIGLEHFCCLLIPDVDNIVKSVCCEETAGKRHKAGETGGEGGGRERNERRTKAEEDLS